MFYFRIIKNNQGGRDFPQKGFTLIELLIVVALLVLIFTLTAPFGIEFYKEQIINEESSRLIETLKTAQSLAISGKNESPWGVRIFEGYYIMFSGDSYLERNESYDKNFNLPSGIETSGIIEIVFEKNTGNPIIIEQAE